MDPKDKMIEHQLKGRDIYDGKVLRAMREVERELFVPEEMKEDAYNDSPLPIGRGQTISQPYIVAYMAQAMELKPEDKVLEIGSGCGYNAAILSRLVSQVYSIEIIEWLAELARKNLIKAGIDNVTLRYGDGYQGWYEKAPFDKIMLTAAAPRVPNALKEQLKTGGKLLIPLGNGFQKLTLIKKTSEEEFVEHDLIPVRFVPLTGGQKE
ncbi:MAG: protein-L-isoaspartate(D-aspartate) O-methyltransferase [Bacteroidales bacterium]